MPIKYLIIDDETTDGVRPYRESIEKAGRGLVITNKQPVSFEEQVKSLRGGDFDGLILDLRLDQHKNDEGKGKTVSYTAQGLAQELRSHMSGSSGRQAMTPVPIVLWSVAKNIENLYKKDDTAQDLFDAVYQKDTFVKNKPEQVARELTALADGYKSIVEYYARAKANELELEVFLGLETLNLLDPRVPEDLKRTKRPSVHEVAQFVLRELIHVSGPLVDEGVLAARLGVDIKKSADWPKLLKKLSSVAGYTGVFSTAWNRWWWPYVDEWWRDKLGIDVPLQALDADERVKLLVAKAKFGKLVAAKPIDKCKRTKFWMLCQAYQLPIDPQDGIRAAEPDRAPWQDISYISVQAILERDAHREGLRIHPLDKERWETMKKIKD